MSFETLRLPKLEFFAEPDKGDVRGDAGVLAQTLRQNGASILVAGQDRAGADQGRGELVLLVRIRCEVLDQRVDLVDEPLTAGIERRRIERGIAVDAVEAVFGENGAK